LSAKSAAVATTSRCDGDNDWLQRLHANRLVTTTLAGNGS